MNYTIHYEINDEEVGTVLRASEYGGDEDMAWVLLAALPADSEGPYINSNGPFSNGRLLLLTVVHML